MDLVAKTACVSKATLYAHFASKEALFATIIQDKGLETPLYEGMFPDEVSDLRAVLESMGERLLRFMLRDRTLSLYRVALAEAARFPELGQTFYANGPCTMRQRFVAWLGVLEAAGLVRVCEHEVAAEHFMSLMRSDVFLRRSLSIPPLPSEEEIHRSVKAAVDTWLRAFGG